MPMSKIMSKVRKGAFLTGVLVFAGAGVAQAATVNFVVENKFGSTIRLESSSCTSGSISAPYSISNGSTANFSSTISGSTTMCTVKYYSGTHGCRFVVQVSSVGGLTTSNAYKGTPDCTDIDVPNQPTGTRTGKFSFSP